MSDRDAECSSPSHRLHRRTFLKVTGLTVAGLLGAHPVFAAAVREEDAAEAFLAAQGPPDPIFAKAAELDFDAQRIFRFVADEVRYEPYTGCLRGAAGAMANRAGNSIDQAVLLAGLLDASAIPVRFVSGPIDHEHADAMHASLATDLEGARQQYEASLGLFPQGVSDREPTADDRELIEALPDIVDRTIRLVEERTDRATGMLMSALQGAGIAVSSDAAPMPDQEIDRHTWVQAALGPDWVDLDPSVSDAVEGAAYAVPVGEPQERIPDEFRHRVEFVLTTESFAGGELSRTVVIEHAVFADELAGLPVVFAHEKPEGLEALGVALQSTLQGGVQYQPVLSVGDVTLVGIEPLVFGSGGGLLDEGPAGSVGEGETTAEWLEVRVISPDREIASRRTLFDRIGDETRASGAAAPSDLAPVETYDIDAELTDEFAPMRVVHFLDVATGSTSADRFLGGEEPPSESEALTLYPATYHLLRDGLISIVGSPRGVRTFIDAPNIVDFSLSLQPGPASPGEEKVNLAVDLLVRSAGNAPLIGSPLAAPAMLVAGLIEHEAERLAAGDGPKGEPFPDIAVDSVGAVFEAAAEQAIDLVVLREASDVDAMPLRQGVAQRLVAGLQDGWVVVVPRRPVQLHGQERIGWWRVHPASGVAIDVFEDGRGTAMPDETGLYYRIAFWVRKFVCLGLAIKNAKTWAKLFTGDDMGFLIGLAVGYPLHKLLGGHCH